MIGLFLLYGIGNTLNDILSQLRRSPNTDPLEHQLSTIEREVEFCKWELETISSTLNEMAIHSGAVRRLGDDLDDPA